MTTIQCRIKEFIQPFERDLALREMHALCSSPITPLDGTEETASVFSIQANGRIGELRKNLTFWNSVGEGSEDITEQVRGEATSLNHKSKTHSTNGRENALKLPRRRCLRYATHGIHEYRGKFFPQLVRALMNIARVPSDGIVVDPMCGSGTALVEATLSGRSTFGLDMNPLSVFLSRVKCRALSLSSDSLSSACQQMQQALRSRNPQANHHKTLATEDQRYLQRWFAPSTLVELDQIHAAIHLLDSCALRDFFFICLSNVLRSVSWQKKDDLRIRKEVVDLEEGEVVGRFLKEARRSANTVSNFVATRGEQTLGSFEVLEADARTACNALSPIVGRADLVITSPPYATALPYIETDRLSLIYLGLLPRPDHALRDRQLIGSREVSIQARREYWTNYETLRNLLPRHTRQVIDRIHDLNSNASVGFRRKNVAALLSKYFIDMRKVLISMRQLLRPGGVAFLVVGDNRTTAGGEIIQIRTSSHLAAIAESLDFRVEDTLAMDMLRSRDIFRKNSVSSETIIKLGAPTSV